MRITGGQVFDLQGGFVERELFAEGALLSESGGGEILDASGCYVIPGLVDVHFHGCMGADFSDASPEGLEKIAAWELSRGVMYLCPASMTLPEETLLAVCRNAAAHRRKNPCGAEVSGVHLEGPFLSGARKGAQNGKYLRAPDPAMLERLQEAAGRVKLVTLAPELPGALEFIRAAKRMGIAVSLGHTEADYDTAKAAFEAGADHVTHLYNAMPPFGHRAPSVIGAAFDARTAWVELICDGVHVHPCAVRAAFRLFGAERMVLVSDSMRAAGMPDGNYTLGGQAVTVKGPLCTLPDGTIAGSASSLTACMKTAVSFGVPLWEAVRAASYNPACSIGLEDRIGSLEAGREASLILLDRESLELRGLLFKGRRVKAENRERIFDDA